jgi:hypothetical protein
MVVRELPLLSPPSSYTHLFFARSVYTMILLNTESSNSTVYNAEAAKVHDPCAVVFLVDSRHVRGGVLGGARCWLHHHYNWCELKLLGRALRIAWIVGFNDTSRLF